MPSPRTPSHRASCRVAAADQADGERHDAHNGSDDQPGLQQPLAGVHAHGGVDRETGSQQQGRGQEEVVAAKDTYVDAGDHHHQEHEPRPEEHGSDDGEARERREIGIEVELDKEPGERGEKDRERGGENEPYRRVRLEYALPEAFQEVPGDPHLGGDDDADPDQRHPRVRLLQQVERLEPRAVARVYDPLGDDAFDQGPRRYTYERRQ